MSKVIPMRHIRWTTRLGAIVASILFPLISPVSAQLMPVPDDTLGENASTLRPIDPNYPGDVVEGGVRTGNALFHSFREFHVEAGRAIYFDDPGVDSILSRVTGNTESQILGLLGVFGDADLFLLNPNGIIFGRGARLDLRGGSFLATTADDIEFETIDTDLPDDGDRPLLTIRPSAFLFSRENPAAIVNNSQILLPTGLDTAPGGGLRVADGERITLLGGDISMDRGGLSALGGQIEIGGMSGSGRVAFNVDGSLTFLDDAVRSNVSIANGSRVVASDFTTSGGSVTITANELDITNGSGVSAGTVGESGFTEGQAGDITLEASRIRLDASVVDNIVRASRSDGGDVLITADEFSMSNGSNVQSTLLGEGRAGKVRIETRDRTTIDGSLVSSGLGGGDRTIIATGNAGNIEITTPTLLLMDGAVLRADTIGQGDAGDVIINASESFTLERSAILSSVSTNFAGNPAVGNGGDIKITTPTLLLTDDSALSSRTDGVGDAGNVAIEASKSVTLERSNIVSDASSNSVGNPAIGKGGDIKITAPALSLTNGAALSSSTARRGDGGTIQVVADALSLSDRSRFVTGSSGQGSAGDVLLEIRDRAFLDESFIFSELGQVATDAVVANGIEDSRRAGDIQMTVGSLALTNGSTLQSSTAGRGDAGDVTVQARDRIDIRGVSPEIRSIASSIFAITRDGAEGEGGDVNLTADSIRLVDNGLVSTTTSNRFPGGTVTAQANTLELVGGGRILTVTGGAGRAGNINLDIADRTILAGENTSKFDNDDLFFSGFYASTTPRSSGAGGTVRLSTSDLQVLDRARIEVDSQGSGTAGNMAIAVDTVRLDNGRLTAETAAVNGGNIALEDLDVLLLRNNSLISTTAGTAGAGGNGGNINIDANAIVSVPGQNNDIRANAFMGSGGTVRIDASGLFGIEVEPQDDVLTNDITASSEQGIQGTVDITTPDIEPRDGLAELPTAFADVSDQIAQTCSGNSDGQDSEFVVTGRGGLPQNPVDTLIGEVSSVDWATLDAPEEARTSEATASSELPDPAFFAEEGIVEAQGWVKENGKVKLVAASSTNDAQATVACRRAE